MRIKKLHQKAVVPHYATEGSAGLDLAVISDEDTIVIPYKGTNLCRTGLSFEIPKGYVGLIYIRSSVGSKLDLVLSNQVGVIDSDYRGEVMLPLRNLGRSARVIENGTRVAQMVITPINQVDIEVVDELSKTKRGVGGFGSTGK
ncbi:dUTP diphosphatase [Sneathia sanguinegens]|uniref:dUTP diphosphatase n=1 Tax=Sneathia sanguinegens TaxID=40543 RepID=A0ABT7HJU6_9FUSO|nr:dUTP diphosphatase [Sneathia sanguinegens]MDK9580804.1 dUTP diphosphatase [Sneathia sanguinegens]